MNVTTKCTGLSRQTVTRPTAHLLRRKPRPGAKAVLLKGSHAAGPESTGLLVTAASPAPAAGRIEVGGGRGSVRHFHKWW